MAGSMISLLYSLLNDDADILSCFSPKEKNVCKQGGSSNTPIPFGTLTPGLCFVTQYGIVEVINDNREIPYFIPVSESTNEPDFTTADLKKQTKLYHNAVLKNQMRDQKQLLNVAVVSLARRKLLRHAYHDHLRRNENVTAATTNGTNDSKNSVATFVDTIRHAYCACGDVSPLARVPKTKELEDPSAPATVFPDRIVECRLLPDRRPRYTGNYDNLTLLDGLANTDTNSNKIFVQRRLLTTPYNLDSERYYCPSCYQCFTSKPGYKYHVDVESCIRKAKNKADAMQQQLAAIESRAILIVGAIQQQQQLARLQARAAPIVRATQQSQQLASLPARAVQVVGATPQQLSLLQPPAVQAVATTIRPVVGPIVAVGTSHTKRNEQSQNERANHGIDLVGTQPVENPEPITKTDTVKADTAKMIHPETTFAQLESELYRALGLMIGPMYPEVWTALGYRKVSNKVKKHVKRKTDYVVRPILPNHNDRGRASAEKEPVPTKNDTRGGASVEKEPVPNKNDTRGRASVEKEAANLPVAAQHAASRRPSITKPMTAIPPIIDIRPLAQEIDAGRYPSMKRFVATHPDDRDTVCAICKTGQCLISSKSKGDKDNVEHILPCDFCRQAEHYTCAITKFIIKYPEPSDDFMCHSCIGVLSTRRSRAERRRLEKLIAVNADSATVESVVLQHPKISQAKQEEIVSLTNNVVPNREFECVAAQGRRLDELHILLRDAQTRLSLALDVEDINQNRLALFDTLTSDFEV